MPQTLLFQPSQTLPGAGRAGASASTRQLTRSGSNADTAGARGEPTGFRQTLDRATRRDEPTETPPEKPETKSAATKSASSCVRGTKRPQGRNESESADRTESNSDAESTQSSQAASENHQPDSNEEQCDTSVDHHERSAGDKLDDASTEDGVNRAAAEQAISLQQQTPVERQDSQVSKAQTEGNASVEATNGNSTGASTNPVADASVAEGQRGVTAQSASDSAADQSAANAIATDDAAADQAEPSTAGSKLAKAAAATRTRTAARGDVESDRAGQTETRPTTGQVKFAGTGVPGGQSSDVGDQFDSEFASALADAIGGKEPKSPDDREEQPVSSQADPTSTQKTQPHISAESHQVGNPSNTDSSRSTPETRFVAANHENVVSGVKAELLPNGGTMKLRLDPPELGTMQVSLHMRDGVVTASFQTNNDEATRLLSHSLGDLRTTLEANGIIVDKLQVQQAPKDETFRDASSRDTGGRPGQSAAQDPNAQRDQQRKDMVQRLWDKLAGNDPLDMVA